MKKLLARWIPLLLAAALCGCTADTLEDAAPPTPDKVELHYFYDELCSSCDGAEAFDAIAAERLAPVWEPYPYAIYRHSIYNKEGREVFRQLCDSMGLDAYPTAGEDLFERGSVYNPAPKKPARPCLTAIPMRRTVSPWFTSTALPATNATRRRPSLTPSLKR